MKPSRSSTQDRTTLDVMEQAFVLLRSTPARTWTLYLLGSVPFLFLVLYFWTDMSYNAFAVRRVAPFALLLALAYVTMKVFHAFFSRALLDSLALEDPEKITPSSFLAEFRSQVITQVSFLALLPLSILTLLPFGWLVAMAEHWPLVSAEKGGLLEKLQRCWAPAREDARENHLLLWLTSPLLFVLGISLMLLTFHFMIRFSPGLQEDPSRTFFFLSGTLMLFCLILSPGCAVVAFNIGLFIYMLPGMVRTFSGLETNFSLSGWHFFNTTFILTVSVLSYLAVKPLNLAVYVIRHFLSVSIKTGADLKASAIRHFARILPLLLVVLCLGKTPAGAETMTAPAPLDTHARELGKAIEKSAAQPEYAWRLPKFQAPSNNKGLLEDFFVSVSGIFKSIGDSLKKFYDDGVAAVKKWLEKWKPEETRASKPFDLFESLPSLDKMTWIVGGLSLLSLMLAVWMAYRYRLGRRGAGQEVIQAQPVLAPDVTDENTTADLLPSDEWMQLAERLIQEGQYRPALRAMYLGLLARLAQGGFFVIHPAKSNRDYRTEFGLHSRHNLPGCDEFNSCVFLFERCWYGTDPVDASVISRFQSHYEQLRNASR